MEEAMDWSTLHNVVLFASMEPTIIDKVIGLIIVTFFILLVVKGGG